MGEENEIVAEAIECINGYKTTEASKKIMQDFAYYLISLGIGEFSIMRHLGNISYFFEVFDLPTKNIEDITKEDVQKVIAKLMADKNVSLHKRRRLLLSVKKAFKYLLGNNVTYPPSVAWVTTNYSQNKEKLPEELLSEDEIKLMIDYAYTFRDKCIIALLWDTGMRIGELTNIKIKDVDLSGKIGHVQVFGKTGARRIPLFFSVPYITQYLEERKKSKNDDSLFVSEGSWTSLKKPSTRDGIAKMLWVTAEKAGIKKHIYPHLFRHSRASFLANKLTEPQMRQFFGWSKGSDMTSVYVHLSGRDLDNAFLEVNDQKPMEKQVAKLTVAICPRCRKENPATSLYCVRCGSPLNLTDVLSEEEDKKELDELIIETLRNPDIKAELVKILKKQLGHK
jgi:site-specific recombinase XerD